MPQKLNIITSTDNTGLGWILEVLGISTLLIDKSKKTKINIDLLDGSPFLFKHKIYSILRKVFLSLPYIFKTTFFILKFFFNEKKVSRLQKNLEFNSIENRLIANEIVNLEFFNCEVEIKRISLNLSSISYFFIFLKSVFFWVKIYFSKKKYNSFLNFRYRNIHIGDLVASTFLRIHTKYGGNLKMNLDLYKIFLKAVYLCDLSKKIEKGQFSNSFFLHSEPIYLENLWKRKFLNLKSKIIETHSYDGKLKICNYKKKYINPWILPKNTKKIKLNDIKNIDKYFKKRFSKPHLVLEYLRKDGTNNNKKLILQNLKNKKINIKKNKIYSVIYLHAFEDAQYCFGVNDFKDIYEWTKFTIDKCLENNNFEKILIKPHPTTNHDYKADKIAFNMLYNSYSKNKKIEFLDQKTSIFAISGKPKFFHFVHHGSVAIELAYLDEDVVGFIGGPWSKNYKFLKTWVNKKEYEKIIKNIKSSKSFNSNSKKDLYLFVKEAYMDNISLQNRSIRLIVSKKNPIFKDEYSGSKIFAKKLKFMKSDDKLLKHILNLIFNKYSQLNKIY